MGKRHWSVILGLAGTAVFLWLALRNVPFSELSAVLSSARWPWVAVIILGMFADLIVRACKWLIILSQPWRSFSILFQLETIGLAVNNIMFLRLGELARAYLAGRRLDLPLPRVLSSVAVERILDTATLLMLFCISSSFHPDVVSPQLRLFGAVALTGIIIGIVALVAAQETLAPEGYWEKRLRRWPKLRDVAMELAQGVRVLRNPSSALAVAGLNVLLWSIDAFNCWAAARALGLERFVDFSRSVLILSWAAAGTAIPAAPGAFGTFEAMVKSILESFGATAAEAVGYAVFIHMLGYCVVTGLGAVLLYRLGLSFSDLKAELNAK